MPNDSPPSLLRRPGCWITFLTVFPLLIGGLYLTENTIGTRRLARVMADLAAAGIELDAHKIPPSRPPDAENFFATPLLAAVGSGTAFGPEMRAARRIGEWDRNSWTAKARIEPVHSVKPTDWASVRDAIAARDINAAIVPTDDPIADLSNSLERDLGPIFAELTAALARPKSHQVPDFYDRLRAGVDPVRSDEPWVSDILALASTLEFRARLDLEAGRPGRVPESVMILLKIAEGAEADGSTLALPLSNSVRRKAQSTAWLAAERRLLPRQAWLDWAQGFSRPRPLDRLPEAMRAAMIHAQHGMNYLRVDPRRLAPGSHPSAPLALEPWQQAAMQLIPRGWIDINEAYALQALGELSQHFQDAQPPNYFSRETMDALIRPRLEANRFPFHRLMVRLTLPVYLSFSQSSASTQAVSRLAEAACALEAWFLDHQAYPPALDSLVPVYLPAIPLDFDGQPIRYAQEPANGRYRLWSLGEDGVDDGGVEKTNRGRPTAKPLVWKEPIGDWVWHYAR